MSWNIPPIVTGDNHQCIADHTEGLQRLTETPDRKIQVLNKVTVGAAIAFSTHLIRRRDGMVHSNRRKIQKEGFVAGLFQPVDCPVRQVRHDLFVVSLRGIKSQIGRPIKAPGIGIHPVRFQTIDAIILDIDACHVPMVLGHGKVIIKTHVQGSWTQRTGPVLRGLARCAIAQVPLANGRRSIPPLLQPTGQGHSLWVRQQGVMDIHHTVFHACAPGIAPHEQAIPRG